MPRNERQTCAELIEPALEHAGWRWRREVVIGPGRVSLAGDRMYDASQRVVADYVLSYWCMPLVVLEAKAEGTAAIGALQQGERYARRLGIRFVLATNGSEWVLLDTASGAHESMAAPPEPGDLLARAGIVLPDPWRVAFECPWHEDLITRKKVRPYQECAIYETLRRFANGQSRVLLLMATGTGKTFTVFQLVWKLLQGNALPRGHVLFLTDRNSLKNQAYRAFTGFSAAERVVIDKTTVGAGEHLVGKVFFANYQNLDEELGGRKLYEHFDADFFDLVVVDECHRSGFGDWFGVLQHFGSALHLGLTATPRELRPDQVLTGEERRRDTFEYFGDPVYTYSLRQAIEDGYLVPYLLEQRMTNLDVEGYQGPDGTLYTTANFERDIRLPERTRAIAEDLWRVLGTYGLRDEKSIVFCVDDTHAAFMAAELRRLSEDPDYAARITRSERNSHQLEANFQEVGRAKPRVAVTVDLLSTGYDAPDVKNIVFVRPLQSPILYKQMKGRGTRLCDDIDKRYFTIFDYAGVSALEDAEFDGHPLNQMSGKQTKARPTPAPDHEPRQVPVAEGVQVAIVQQERFVCLADGRRIPFAEYCEMSRELILDLSSATLDDLLAIWIDRDHRADLRARLRDSDVHVAAFRYFYDLAAADDVDILAKVGFELPRVPTRHNRIDRFWEQDGLWLRSQVLGMAEAPAPLPFPVPAEERLVAEGDPGAWRLEPSDGKLRFWRTCLDHYALYGIDDLEQGSTYRAPQFTEQFGGFGAFLRTYGGAARLRDDLELVKTRVYVPMTA